MTALKVSDVMTKHPRMVHLDTPVKQAAELMRTQVTRHLPVVDEAEHHAHRSCKRGGRPQARAESTIRALR